MAEPACAYGRVRRSLTGRTRRCRDKRCMHDAALSFNPFAFWLQTLQAGSSFFSGQSSGDADVGTSVPALTHRRDGHCLYVPDAALPGRAPMVVMLHGAGQDAEDFAACTAMNAAAERHGFVVLYPAQSSRVSANRCWTWWEPAHQQRASGEPARLVALTQQVAAEFNVDSSRIYVAGLSAGGAMAALLGELFPDVYAAVGVHSGLAPRAGTDLSSALAAMRGTNGAPAAPSGMPTIVFHGERDTTVHPVNGHRVVAAAVGSDCEVTAQQRFQCNGRSVTRVTLRGGPGARQFAAEHWQLHDADHAWSGGDRAGSYADPAGPEASEEMLRFFDAQRLGCQAVAALRTLPASRHVTTPPHLLSSAKSA